MLPKLQDGVVKTSQFAQLTGFAFKAFPFVSFFNGSHCLSAQVPFDAFGAKIIGAVFFGTTYKVTPLGTPAAIFVFAFVVSPPGAFEVKVFANLADRNS